LYFVALCVQQIENSSHQTSRKATLKSQMQLMVEIWTPG
jgi:hypothetical protein